MAKRQQVRGPFQTVVNVGEISFALCGLTYLVRTTGLLQWTLTESALDQAEVHRRLEAARDRQFRALSFPAGIKTIEEMEKMWAKINFGAKQDTQEMIAIMKELTPRSECVFVPFCA